MSKTTVVTSRITPELSEKVDELAQKLDRSRGYVIAKAIEGYVEAELALLAFVQEGVDSLDRGEGISTDDLIAGIEAKRRLRNAA